MKSRSIFFTAVLAMVATTSMVAQSNSWSEQWYRAKFGRPSPTEEARIQAAQENTAYREVTPAQTAVPSNAWFEGWYRAKFGRPSPTEEARIQTEQANTAYREVTPTQAVTPTNAWFEGWYRAKFGRPSPTEEARLSADKQATSKPAVVAPNDPAASANDHRLALAKCMKATEQVRILASDMQATGRPWGRGRIGFSKNDLVILSDYRDELRLAVSNLAAVHQELLKGLSEAQEQRLEQPLLKLDHLQSELSSRMSEFDRDLRKTEPGPDSTGIAWDVSGLKRVAEKWSSEHRKMEKKMELGPDRSSNDLRSTQYGLSYARNSGE